MEFSHRTKTVFRNDRIHKGMNEVFAKLKMYGIRRFVMYSALELYRKVWLEGILRTFSQNGEDVVIHGLLKNKRNGFYVDIGANDPTRFSNTKYFYLQGWHGINIEPDLDGFIKIKKGRPNDINLNLGIGKANSKLIFYQFFPNTLSTFSESEAKKYQKQGYKLLTKKVVKVMKLTDVLGKYLKGKKIDFMTIDTEGYDMEVLESNNWSKYRPRVICIESVRHLISGPGKDIGLEVFLINVGYKKLFDNGLNSFYLDSRIYSKS